MHRPYLLPRELTAVAVTSLRHYSHAPPLKISDPAARAMTDFQREPPLTVTEDLALEWVLDEMFRLGVRAFLVVQERVVTGLITAERAGHARGSTRLTRSRQADSCGPRELCVVDVMTPVNQVPAVDWTVIDDAQIRDLMEIFEGSGALHLVVLESESPSRSSVRGLIHRDRLERQLGTRWTISSDATG